MDAPSAPSHAELNDPGVDEHTVVYTGIPIRVDGELSRTLSFSGSSETCRSRAEDAAEYLKLLAQWVEAQHTQERTREAMHRSEKRYREIFAAAPDAYAVIDSDTECLVDCNEAALHLLGRHRDQILGEHYSTLHPPHYLWKHGDTHARWLGRVIEHGHWLSSDVPVRSGRQVRDRTYVDISARHVDLGDTPYVLAVLRDVTQRKETGDALLQAAARNQEFNDELRTLVRVSTGLETDLDSNVVAQRIVAGTVDTIGPAVRASLWRFRDDTAALLTTDRPREGTRVHDDVQVPMASGLFSTIEDDIAPIHVPDVGAARALDAEIAHPSFFGVKSLVAVPIATNERVLGALVAESTDSTHRFHERHVDLLRSLGAQAAVSLHNAHALEEVRALSQRLLQAQEDERQRLAQELHDETGGLLTALQFKLQEVQMCMAPSSLSPLSTPPADDPHSEDPASPSSEEKARPPEPPTDSEAVDEVLSALDGARELTMNLSDLLRRVSRSLRPKILDDIGLSAALPWLVREYGEQSGLDISFSSTIDPDTRYPALVETAAFRIIQEALTNAAKYAGTDEVQVVVNAFDDRIRLHVIDEGAGFDADAWRRSTTSTLGLHGMIERAERLGGAVEIASDSGEGTRISATLPTTLDENHG
jgi:PAS domain S-box-containing protein